MRLFDMDSKEDYLLDGKYKVATPYAPCVDIVEVVRCKDCCHCEECYGTDGYPYWRCNEWDGGTNADGYCHYGERSEVEE